MFKPEPKIRHASRPGAWPSRDEAARSRLFSPVRVGPLDLHERSWVPAMVPWRASEDGFVTDEVVAWYERFARAAPGAIVIEATGVRDVPSGPLLRAGHDRYVPGLARIAEAVRRASTSFASAAGRRQSSSSGASCSSRIVTGMGSASRTTRRRARR